MSGLSNNDRSGRARDLRIAGRERVLYLERAVQALRDSGKNIDEKLLPHLSPLGWEHINLTGDYIWRQNKHVEQGKFRPLRLIDGASVATSRKAYQLWSC